MERGGAWICSAPTCTGRAHACMARTCACMASACACMASARSCMGSNRQPTLRSIGLVDAAFLNDSDAAKG
eukprot:356295-Chlamydomonas_euryale.AAC.25